MNIRTQTDIIPKIQQYLATQPVERAWLFGSFSRGEEREDSDVMIGHGTVPCPSMSFRLTTSKANRLPKHGGRPCRLSKNVVELRSL